MIEMNIKLLKSYLVDFSNNILHKTNAYSMMFSGRAYGILFCRHVRVSI